MLDVVEIQRILPHRYPILLVDRIVEMESDKRAVGIKNVTVNEEFFQGHFPGRPVMPGVLIVEALAQTAGILMGSDEGNAGRIPLFMGIDKARFRRQVVPGDQLRLEVEIIQQRRNVVRVMGRAFVGEERAAEAEILATLADAE